MQSYETLLTEIEDGVLTITLNRPDKLNAFNPPMSRDMLDIFGRINEDDSIRAVIVTGKAQHATVFCRTSRIAVTKHIAAAINAWPLAIPDADDAVVVRARRQLKLLRAPDRRCGKILVHARLKLDAEFVEVATRGHQLLVVATQRRSAIAGDEGGGIEARRAVAAHLRHRQTNQRLRACQEDVAAALRIFMIETDPALIDTHRRLTSVPTRLASYVADSYGHPSL